MINGQIFETKSGLDIRVGDISEFQLIVGRRVGTMGFQMSSSDSWPMDNE